MKLKNFGIALPLFVLIVVGCSKPSEGDTSPLPPQDTTTRVQTATNNVKKSDMTPEQQKAAEEYLRQGAAGAEQMRKLAQQQGAAK
jgi:hypothetical protein